MVNPLFNSIPGDCTKGKAKQFCTISKPMRALLFSYISPTFNTKMIFAHLCPICKKTQIGTCWMSGTLLGNRTKKVSSSWSEMLAFRVGNLTNLYNNFSTVSPPSLKRGCQEWKCLFNSIQWALSVREAEDWSQMQIQFSPLVLTQPTQHLLCVSLTPSRHLPSCPATFRMAFPSQSEGHQSVVIN